MLDRTAARAVWMLLGLASCGEPGGGAGSASATATSSAPARSATASSGATASSAAAAPTSSAAPASPALTKEAFCERAVKLGEANLAKCNKEDENQRTYLDFKPAVAASKEACEARVLSAQVDFQASVASSCLAAAEKRGGATSFLAFAELPECRGVLVGKVAAGQPAKLVEECAPGLSLRNGKCEAPAKENADCAGGGSILSELAAHPGCEAGLACRAIGDGVDGEARPAKCVKAALGERCDALVGNCPDGASCYQGRCRAFADLGAQCMHDVDCKYGTTCDIQGGLFGKCAAQKPLGEKCTDHSNCASGHCRAAKCSSFCGSG